MRSTIKSEAAATAKYAKSWKWEDDKRSADRRSLTFIPRSKHNEREAGRTHEFEDGHDLKTWHVRTQVHMG